MYENLSCTFATSKSSPSLSLPSLETNIVENSGPEIKPLVTFDFEGCTLLHLWFRCLCTWEAQVWFIDYTLAKPFSMVLVSLQ